MWDLVSNHPHYSLGGSNTLILLVEETLFIVSYNLFFYINIF